MATLTITFDDTVANAIKYRIKVRQTGTTTYAIHEVTSSPLVINNVPCGLSYEGTIQTICFEGVPCDRYRISTTDPSADGDANYEDCATGNSASQAIIGSGDFYVCSRTTPIIIGSSSTSVTKVSQGTCTSPSPEEASAPTYWTAPAATCPSDSYKFVLCSDGTTEKLVSQTIWNSNVVYGSAPTVNKTYKIDFDGNGYVCWTYISESDSTQHPSGLTIPLDVDQSIYESCSQCQGTYAHKFVSCDNGSVTWVLPSAWTAQSGGTPPVLNAVYRVSLGNNTACYTHTDTGYTTTAVTSQVGSTIDPYDNCATCPDNFYYLEKCGDPSTTLTGYYLSGALTLGQAVRVLGYPTDCWQVMGVASSGGNVGVEITNVYNDCNSCAV